MCKVEKLVAKKGFTISTAKWICEMARELRVSEEKFFKTVYRLAKRGVWLEEEDWLFIARVVDLGKHLDIVVRYILARVSSGVQIVDAVKELPKAVEKAGKLAHIREILSNLI